MTDRYAKGRHDSRHATRPAPGAGWKKIWSRGLICAGAVMVPWSVCVLHQLPQATTVSGWNMAWAGLDLMEAAGLAGTGVLLARGDERYRLCAAAVAALLLADAWFDVVTAASGHERAVAAAMAVGAELPAAALCAALAARNRAHGGGAGSGRPRTGSGRESARRRRRTDLQPAAWTDGCDRTLTGRRSTVSGRGRRTPRILIVTQLAEVFL